jgi:ferritin-like metal-binding protein YciE
MSSLTITARGEDMISSKKAVRGPVADERAASALGWFSLALGAVEVLAPHALARAVGLELNPTLVKLLGAREMASGVGLLTQSRRTKWLFGRVAGDLMDLAVLGVTPLRKEPGAQAKFTAATAAVLGVTLVDMALSVRYALKGRVGGRRRTPREQLVHFLSDMYSVEQQALAQMVSAPNIAKDATLAEDFRRHYTETEHQADLVRERLEAHGGSPSTIKDAVMKLGGKGFLLFARVMPETTGRLVVHAYSYEAMEWAGYEMLARFAERAGDSATVEVARIVGDQERAMMERLERGFDAAEQVSHADISMEELGAHIVTHIAEVHAFESQSIQLLEKSERIAGDALLASVYRRTLHLIREHSELVEQRLETLDTSSSKLIDAALAAGGLKWGLFFQAQSDTPAKLAAFVYAVLHLEIGGYELLKRTANRAGDNETKQLCEIIIAEKRAAAEQVIEGFDIATDATLRALQR